MLLDYCMAFIDIPVVIRYYLNDWRPKRKVKCLWHAETQGSLSIDKRGFGRCFGCNVTIKHIFDLAVKVETGKSEASYAQWKRRALVWYRHFVPIISTSVVEGYHKHLLSGEGQEAYSYLVGPRRLLSDDTIRSYRLGLDPETNRITTPIVDFLGNIVNIKKFNWKRGQKGAKAISYFDSSDKRYGTTRLFPEAQTTTHNEFVLCEGEWDALLLLQNHIPAVTWTNGANSWDRRSEVLLSHKKIVLCFDADEGGRTGLRVVQDHVSSIPKENSPPQLYPLAPPAPPKAVGKDITDWFREDSRVLEALREALRFEVAKKPKTPPRKTVHAEYLKLKALYESHLYMEDPFLMDIVFATALANRFFQDMIWTVMIAPAGGLKTEMIRSLGKCEWAKEVSRITGHTFVSGYKRSKDSKLEDSSLAFLLRGKLLLNKDLTNWTEMERAGLNDVLSQLREFYDGFLPADWGHGEGIRWEGHFGILAGVTPRIDHVIAVQAKVGERFLYYRLIRGDETRSTRQSLINASKREPIRKELQTAAAEFLHRFSDPLEPIDMNEKYYDRLIEIARIVCLGRATVPRLGFRGKMAGFPILERATRPAAQLGLFAQSLAYLNGEKGIGKRTWEIILRIAYSSVPALRRCVLLYLQEYEKCTALQVSDTLRIGVKAVKDTLEECWSLGLVDKDSQPFRDGWSSEEEADRESNVICFYCLNNDGKQFLHQMKADKWTEVY